MATRSRIGIENEDGTITNIYCHWNGYPDHNGKILSEYYNTHEKVTELMALGDLSVLEPSIGMRHDFDYPTPGWCLAYGRDRGDKNVSAGTEPNLKWFHEMGEEYNYLFTKQGEWVLVFSPNHIEPLAQHLS